MVHEKILKPIGCEKCDKRFHSQSRLKYYLVSHENGKSRDFKCVTCGKSFTLNLHLKLHVARGVHEKSNDFACETCPNKFKTDKALELHVINMHIKREKNVSVQSLLKNILQQN